MTPGGDAPRIESVTDLFAVAYQIEIDAVERYAMLTEQMANQGNTELAAVFRDLARAEGLHAAEILQLGAGMDVPERAPRVARWTRTESPEAVDMGEAHYLMTRWDALRLALAGEERALAYYRDVARDAVDPELRTAAARFIEEETAHVELCHRLLRKYPPPPADADRDDPDSPVAQG